MRAYEIAKEAFALWKKDVGKFILPSAEYYLATIIVSSILVFGILGITGILMVLSIIGLIGGFILGKGMFFFGPLSLIMLPFLFILIFVIFIPVLLVLMSFISGILNGGLSRSILDIISGRVPRFGDVLRTGWKDRWSLMKVELLKVLIILVVTVPPITVVAIIASPFLVVPILGYLVFYLLVWAVSMAIGIAVLPFQYLPYLLYWKEGRRGWAAISGSMTFISDNWRETLGLGLLFQLANMALMVIPGLGMIIALLAPAFFFTCLSILYEEGRRRAHLKKRMSQKRASDLPLQ